MPNCKSSPLNIVKSSVKYGRSELICMDADENTTRLIDAILMTDNVPHTVYHIQDGRLFVFEKMVHLMHTKLLHNPKISLDSAVEAVLDAAFSTSPREAVEDWGVVPEPYYEDSITDGNVVYRTKNQRFPDVPAWHKEHMYNVFTACLTDYVSQSISEQDGKQLFVGKQVKTGHTITQAMRHARQWNTSMSISQFMHNTRKWNTKVESIRIGG